MQTVSEKLKELQKVLQPSPLSPINKVYLFVWAYFSIDFLGCFIISRPRWIWPDGSIFDIDFVEKHILSDPDESLRNLFKPSIY